MSAKRTVSTGVVVGIGAAVVALAAAITWAIVGTGTLHIVNGLKYPILVKIDGREVKVSYESRAELPGLRSGTYLAEVTTVEGAPVEKALIFSRGGRGTLVYNPGGVAPVIWERIEYSRYGGGQKPEARVYCGQTVIDLDDVDHPFTTPPSTISTKGGGSVYRTVLLLEPKGAQACLSWAFQQQKHELVNKLVAYVRRGEGGLAGTEPDDFVARRAEILAALQKTPDDFLWRRAWVDLHDSLGLGSLIIDAARADAEKAGATAADLYMYGRLLPLDEQEAFLASARQKFPKDPYLAWSQAHVLSGRGRHDDALAALESTGPHPDWKPATLKFRAVLLMHLNRPGDAYQTARDLVALPPTKYWKPDVEEALLLSATRDAAPMGGPLNWSFLKEFSRWRAEAMLEIPGTKAKDAQAQASARVLITMALEDPDAALRQLETVSTLEVQVLPEDLRLALWLEADRQGFDFATDGLADLQPSLEGAVDLRAVRHYVLTGEERKSLVTDSDSQRAIYRLARIRELQSRGLDTGTLATELRKLDVLHGVATRALKNWSPPPPKTAQRVLLVSGN